MVIFEVFIFLFLICNALIHLVLTELCRDVKEKQQFWNNLADRIALEYKLEMSNRPSMFLRSGNLLDVIEWKFRSVDKDHDEVLNDADILKILFEPRVLRPTICTVGFFKTCDSNLDGRLELNEWITCAKAYLRIDSKRELLLDDSNELEIRLKPDSDGDETFNEMHFKKIAHKKSQTLWPAESVKNSELSDKLTGTKDGPNCCDKRQNLVTEISIGFLPMCDNQNDRFFSETQCSGVVSDFESESNSGKSLQSDTDYFCWCANPLNGKPLVGTTTFRELPANCHKIRSKTLLSPKIKGCTSNHQIRFFERLFFRFSLEKSTNVTVEKDANVFKNNPYAPTELRTGREILSRWKFNEMDINQDQMVDKQEWKTFREHIRKWSRFHKCARNFIRFCDTDRNHKLVISEWITCTILAYERSRIPPKAQLNPFIYVLKSA